MSQQQANEIITKKEYVLWLEMSLASALKTIEDMHKDLFQLTHRNIYLEDENIATSFALMRNPLRKTKEFNA